MPIWLQPWEVIYAGGQFEGRQPGSLRAGGSSDAVGDRGQLAGGCKQRTHILPRAGQVGTGDSTRRSPNQHPRLDPIQTTV